VIEDVDIAEPGPGEIRVRLEACGICHTDLSAHEGRLVRTPMPIVLGHEGVGRVERTGEDVTGIRPGDRVLLCASACGACPNCRRRLPSYCDEAMPRNFGGLRPDGTTRLSQDGRRLFGAFLGQSAFARYAVVSARDVVALPDDLAPEHLAPLACGASTGAGAVLNDLRVAGGDGIAIFGVGAVGLSAVMAARLVGAERIIAVDRLASRLRLALELGATDVIDASSLGASRSVRDIRARGVEFSFDTTGDPAVFQAAIDCLAMHGTAGFVAAPTAPVPLSMRAMLNGGRTLRAILGGGAAPADLIPVLIEHFRAGRFGLDRLTTAYPFESIAAAFDDAAAGRTIKPVLMM
jgi:aryl-alcohol dehydrogenase